MFGLLQLGQTLLCLKEIGLGFALLSLVDNLVEVVDLVLSVFGHLAYDRVHVGFALVCLPVLLHLLVHILEAGFHLVLKTQLAVTVLHVGVVELRWVIAI